MWIESIWFLHRQASQQIHNYPHSTLALSCWTDAFGGFTRKGTTGEKSIPDSLSGPVFSMHLICEEAT